MGIGEKFCNYLNKKGSFRVLGTFGAIVVQICFIIALIGGAKIELVSLGMIGVIALMFCSLSD